MASRAKRKQATHLRAIKSADTPPVDVGLNVPAAQAAATRVPGKVDPEVVPGPRRRTFTAEFKQQLLAEVEGCIEPGTVGELLRKHGLYSSHLTEWRRQRDEGLRPKKRGRKANGQRALVEENARLRREKAGLEQRLAHAEIIIDVQKKLSVLLGIPLKKTDSEGSDE
jgi:transposase